MSYELIHANVLEWAATYDGPPAHALLCDPPYHLTEITRRFGKEDAAPAQHGRDGAFARASRGFMGTRWDGVGPNGLGIAFDPATWAALAQHLYPGAFGMAFASSRGWHRMAVAIEDAGLIIHPTVFLWNFGSGFPKATKPADQYIAQRLRAWLAEHPDEAAELRAARLVVQQAPDGETTAARTAYQQTKLRLQEAAGLTRVVGQRKHAPKFDAAGHGYREKDNGFNSKERETFDVVEYLDPVAAAWAGHRYGLQALKPAVEPIIVFQKPYNLAPIDSIIETGAGALWIDGGRIDFAPSDATRTASPTAFGSGRRNGLLHGEGGFNTSDVTIPAGRWPANFVLQHLPACNGHCAPGCAVAALAAQSGERPAGNNLSGQEPSTPATLVYGDMGRRSWQSHGDTGGADRFFFNADWVLNQIEQADAVGYHPKASTTEREAGLDPAQVALIRSLYPEDADLPDFGESTVDDGRDTPIDNPYQRGETTRRNTHATIKPLSLTRWLARLLLPPELYAPERRLLTPFAGTGSEMIGGMLAGFDQVIGIELEESHVAIGRARLRYWHQQRHRFAGDAPIKVKAPRRGKGAPSDRQASLFEE